MTGLPKIYGQHTPVSNGHSTKCTNFIIKPEYAWKQKPHVGTDLLRGVITSIRKEIESLGGKVYFNTSLTGFEQKNGQLTGIFTTNGTFPCEALVFAVGHSARDTFGMLMDSGLVLECKPFSVGFRAEHLQSEIEKSLYHEAFFDLALHLQVEEASVDVQ